MYFVTNLNHPGSVMAFTKDMEQAEAIAQALMDYCHSGCFMEVPECQFGVVSKEALRPVLCEVFGFHSVEYANFEKICADEVEFDWSLARFMREQDMISRSYSAVASGKPVLPFMVANETAMYNPYMSSCGSFFIYPILTYGLDYIKAFNAL